MKFGAIAQGRQIGHGDEVGAGAERGEAAGPPQSWVVGDCSWAKGEGIMWMAW
jgi:hypothetical protein